ATASTLKFVKVAPPSSGSLLSAPSKANSAAVPRCPLTANCCVKLAVPFESVMVPAASSSSWLKSRLFRGSSETALLDKLLPPEDCATTGIAEGVFGAVETDSEPSGDKTTTTWELSPGSRMGWEAAAT